MIKIERDKLTVVCISELTKATSLFDMLFCEQVILFVVDEQDKFIGVVTGSDYKKTRDIQTALNRDVLKVYSNEEIEEFVRRLFFVSKVLFVPVLDEEDHLLFSYFKTNLSRLLPYDKDMANVILFEEYNRKCLRFPEKDIYILTDVYPIKDLRIVERVVEVKQLCSFAQKNDVIFLLIFSEAYMYQPIVEELKKHGLKYVGASGCFRANKNAMEGAGGTVDYLSLDGVALEVLRDEYAKGGYYFSMPDMENICQVIRTTQNIPGDYVEIGVFRGDTARLALEYMQKSGIRRKSFFLDTFEGFTYDDANSSCDIIWAGTHTTTSYDLVRKRLEKYDAECHVCNIITDELPEEIEKIAVCNIDVDMEEAVSSALYKVMKRMVSGGIIIAEDYGHMPTLAGANYAVNRFISENEDEFTCLYFPSGQLMLIKR